MAFGAALAPALAAQARDDPVVDTLVDSMVDVSCTCGCCEVQSAVPAEVVEADHPGTRPHTWTCSHPEVALDAKCPGTCQMPPADRRMGLNAVKEAIDYARYCPMYCKPVYGGVGSKCEALELGDLEKMQTKDGNGKNVLWNTNMYAGPKGLQFGGDGSSDAASAESAKEAAEAAQTDKEVVADMRRLIAERLRAEGGAHMSRGAAVAQHIAGAEYMTTRNMMLSKKVDGAVRAFKGKIDTALEDAEADADEASEEDRAAQGVAALAKTEAERVMLEAKELTIAEVKRRIAGPAKREADAQVILRAWDKPPNYPTVLGTKAADPYLRAMVDAITRVSEYNGYAKGLLGQSRGAASKAAALTTRANLEEAHGDKVNAAKDRFEIRGLMSQAKSLESEARKFWKIADLARSSIGEWQIAGTKAAARTAWEYTLAISQ